MRDCALEAGGLRPADRYGAWSMLRTHGGAIAGGGVFVSADAFRRDGLLPEDATRRGVVQRNPRLSLANQENPFPELDRRLVIRGPPGLHIGAVALAALPQRRIQVECVEGEARMPGGVCLIIEPHRPFSIG